MKKRESLPSGVVCQAYPSRFDLPFFHQSLQDLLSLLSTFSFTHGFDRFGIERPATEAIGTRVSRGPVSYGHGQRTAGIAFVALLDQLRARLRRVGNRCGVQLGCTRQGRIEWKPDLVPNGDFTARCTKR